MCKIVTSMIKTVLNSFNVNDFDRVVTNHTVKITLKLFKTVN